MKHNQYGCCVEIKRKWGKFYWEYTSWIVESYVGQNHHPLVHYASGQ